MTNGINLNATDKQVRTFHREAYIMWTNEASRILIEKDNICNTYTVFLNENFDCVLGVFNSLTLAQNCVIENYYAIKCMVFSN